MAVAAVAVAVAVTPTYAQQDCNDMKGFECLAECRPTCGSDGRTYRSPCHLWFAQCSNTTLTKAGRGVCAGEVHWDATQCGYTAGADPKPMLAQPLTFTEKLE